MRQVHFGSPGLEASALGLGARPRDVINDDNPVRRPPALTRSRHGPND
jgi:hypothetical protein